MTPWPLVSFADALVDASAGNRKTPQGEYLPEGFLPVVDQGMSRIAGYTNDEAAAYKGQLPVIVFGDHTRTVKYVDFPFSMGADGTKILRACPGWSPKYLYHYLSHLKIPAAGYSRHFKFLKDIAVPRPPIEEQCRMASILDRAEDLRTKQKRTVTLLEDLSHSVLTETVGSLEHQPVVAVRDVLIAPLRNGLSPSNSGTVPGHVLTLSAITGRRFDSEAVKEAAFDREPGDDQRVSAAELLICRGNGNLQLVGRGVFPDVDMPQVAFPDTAIAARFDERRLNRRYLQQVWHLPFVRKQIESVARTTNGTFKINHQMVKSLSLPEPGLEAQRTFARRVAAVDHLVARRGEQLRRADDLMAAMRHRAFRGEL